jgi:hypothetical protein
MGTAVAPHHAEIVARRQTPSSIPASFKGHVHINGTNLTTTNLKGTIGRDRFSGSGTGTTVNKVFQGGTVSLNNNSGSVEFSLSAAFVVKTGRKTTKQEVTLTAVNATGKYAPYVGMTGTLTTWNVPAKPSAFASFSGSLKI